jgi:hypothetical protein
MRPRGDPRGRGDPLVPGLVPPAHRVDAQRPLGERTDALARQQRGLAHGARERLDVTGLREPARLAADDVDQSAACEGGHRRARRDRLGGRQAERLLPRGRHQRDRARPDQLRERGVVEVTFVDGIAAEARRDLRREVVAVDHRPGQPERHARRARRVDRQVRCLLRHDPAPPRRPRAARPGRPGGEVDAVGHHLVDRGDLRPEPARDRRHRRDLEGVRGAGGAQGGLEPRGRRRVQRQQHRRRYEGSERDGQVVQRVGVDEVVRRVGGELEHQPLVGVVRAHERRRRHGDVAARRGAEHGLEVELAHLHAGHRAARRRMEDDLVARRASQRVRYQVRASTPPPNGGAVGTT